MSESNGLIIPEGRPGLTSPTSGLRVGGCTLTEVGLVPDGPLSREQAEKIADFIGRWHSAWMWWLGDLVLLLPHVMPDEGEQVEFLGRRFKQSTCQEAQRVAADFVLSKRLDNLRWAHHRSVAGMDLAERESLLARAIAENLSTTAFAHLVREYKQALALTRAGQFPDGRYPVLYADPPWEYSDQRTGGIASGAAAAHYPTLSTDHLCALADPSGRPLASIAAADAVLFLWATAPCLPDALRVVEAWGFDYKAQFVWDKARGFNGHYNDVRHELLLVALRGSYPPRCERLPGSVVRAEKTTHSRKPDVFYEIIEDLYPLAAPGLPPSHVELFQRRPRDRWAGWGDEA